MRHTTAKRSALVRDDSGVTLTELIIVVVILGLLAGVVTMTFVNGFISQQSTAVRDLATGRATVITETLADGIRNSIDIRTSSDGKRVDARILLPNSTIACRAWAINSAGELVYSSGSTARSSNTSSWGALAENVSGSLTGSRAFSSAGRALEIGLKFTPAIGASSSPETIVFRTSVTAQATTESRPLLSCF